jgi:hypothetical protein
MADYMNPVHAILQQVNAVEPTTVNKIPVHMYVGGIGVACFVTLMLLSPSIVMSETEDGLTNFSVGKALLFSVAIMVIAYYALK